MGPLTGADDMKLRFWRKDPEPAPEPPPPWAGLTNLADMTEMMIAMEWPATDIVWTLRCVEMRRRIAELETALVEARRASYDATTSKRADKPRVTKPQMVTRNHLRNHATRPKRSR